jgi:O-antigen ligase
MVKYIKIKVFQIDLWLLLIGGLFIIPFIWSGVTIDPVLMPRYFAWSILTGLLAIMFLARLFLNPDSIDRSVLRRGVFLGGGVYFLLSLTSLIQAVNVTEGVYVVAKIFTSIVFLFIATTTLCRNEKNIYILTKSVIVAALVLSGIGLYQCVTQDLTAFGSIMANKNQLSSALFLMLPFCLYGLFAFRTIWKIISIFPAILILADIFLLKTRSVWAALLVSITVAIITVLFMNQKSTIFKGSGLRSQKAAAIVAVLLLISIALTGIYFLQSPDFFQKAASLDSMNERSLLWKQTISIIKDNFVLGVGAGNWKIAVSSYGLDKLPERAAGRLFFQRPHNDFLWVFSEMGLLGFIAYVSLFGIITVYAFKVVLTNREFKSRLLSLCMLCGLIGYIVIAMFSFPKERIFHTVLLLFMMAVLTSTFHQSQPCPKNVSRPTISMMGILAVILLGFSTSIAYLRLTAEIHARRAFAARNAGQYAMVINEIDKGYSKYATLDATSTPLYWYRGEANYLLGHHTQAHEDFKKAYDQNPYHIHVLNNLGTSYEMMKDHKNAITSYKEAIRIWPEFDEALINLGATYYNCGRYKDAYQALRQCGPDRSNKKLMQYLAVVENKLR